MQTGKRSILVVDDTPENIDVLKETLKDDYLIRPALNGELALRIAKTEKSRPDMILLDVMMPGMDGYEVLRRLQADETTRGIPVIFVTAVSDMAGELKGLELGAVDYITKPVNPPVVKARVQTHLALREAQVKLEKQNTALRNERELVEDIITRMRSSKSFDGRYLRYLISSVDRTNGDILLAAFTPDARQWVLVGDLTGHGLPAAVAAPLIAHVFYSQAQTGSGIETALELINVVMCRQLPINIFMAGCLLEISANRREIKLWNAGMPPCLFMRQGEITKLMPRMPPFGITEQIDLPRECETIEVRKDDKLYIFSDGVTEVDNPQGELFGVAGVEEFLSGLAKEGKELDGLPTRLERFRGDSDFFDDITLVEVSCGL